MQNSVLWLLLDQKMYSLTNLVRKVSYDPNYSTNILHAFDIYYLLLKPGVIIVLPFILHLLVTERQQRILRKKNKICTRTKEVVNILLRCGCGKFGSQVKYQPKIFKTHIFSI